MAACVLASVPLLAGLAGAQPSLSDPSLKVETVASGLSSPTQMAFLAANDILVLQKNDGRVRRILNGTLQPNPVLDVAVNTDSERGLLGIAINTASPPEVFLYYTEVADPDGNGLPDGGTPLGNRVYRYTWNAAQAALESPQLVLDLPVLNGPNHDGGVLLLGPAPSPQQRGVVGDGSLLYAVIGDLNRNGQLQNFPAGPPPDDSGVILRVAQDGTPAPGNPFIPYCSQTTTQTCPDGSGCPMGETCVSEVAAYYAYGVRNSFGMALDPVTGTLWDTENGPGSYDEVNLVAPGLNSGWEQIMGPDARDAQGPADLFDMPGSGSTYGDPEFSWLTPIAVTAILFPRDSTLGPAYDDVALVGDFNNAQLYRLPLNAQRNGFDLSAFTGLDDLVADSSVERDALRIGTSFGGITDLEQGPDGTVYAVSIGNGAVYRITSANSVSGAVRYYVGDRPVPDVDLRLTDGGTTTTPPDAAGRFAFYGLGAVNHTLEPQKSGGRNGAISSLDAALVQQAVVGLLEFDAFQILACDVTGDGSISSLDAALIQQLRVGIITAVPVAASCGSDWVFVPAPAPGPNQTPIDPLPATPACQAGAISYEPLAGEVADQDFVAALFGDCSGSWEPAVN